MRAIVLISGGIDSTTILAQALQQGRECFAMSFDYGQRHRLELRAAEAIARHYKVPHKIYKLDHALFCGFKSSVQSPDSCSLTSGLNVPRHRNLDTIATGGIPSTYVPGRNTLFIAHAISVAESIQAQEIYVGFNSDDQAPYPDCRTTYVNAYQQLIDVATKQAIDGEAPKLVTPLIQKNKIDIILLGQELKIPFHLTMSCYDPSSRKEHCGACDACTLRKNAFAKASIEDPTTYKNS